MINDFSSIFEILVALNLGYASSLTLRKLIEKELFKLENLKNSIYKPRIVEIERDVLLKTEVVEKIKTEISNFSEVHYRSIEIIKEKSVISLYFKKGLKSIFLMSTFYSFTILLIGAYEQFYTKDIQTYTINNHTNVLLAFLNLLLFFNLFAFIRNIIFKYHQSNIKNVYTIIYYFIPFILFFIYERLNENIINLLPSIPSFRLNITVSIILGSSSFILFSLRILIVKYYHIISIYILNRKIKKRIDSIERSYVDKLKSIFKK